MAVDGDYTPQQVERLLQDGEIQLIDVREPHEHDAGRIAGALHVPLGDLPERLDALDSSRQVVLYCRSGGRSAMATEALRLAGYDAHNMAGGLIEWSAAGLPMDPPDGCVAEQ